MKKSGTAVASVALALVAGSLLLTQCAPRRSLVIDEPTMLYFYATW